VLSPFFYEDLRLIPTSPAIEDNSAALPNESGLNPCKLSELDTKREVEMGKFALFLIGSIFLLQAPSANAGLSCNGLFSYVNPAVASNVFSSDPDSISIRRGSKEYDQILPDLKPNAANPAKSWSQIVSDLPAGAHVIDITAGTARAVRDEALAHPDKQFTAISYAQPEDSGLQNDLTLLSNLKYHSMDLSLTDAKQIQEMGISQGDLVVDVLGLAQYGVDLKQAIEKLAMFTKTGGLMGLAIIQQYYASIANSRQVFYISDIHSGAGISLEEYLRAFKGLEIVAVEYRGVSASQGGYMFWLKKTADHPQGPPAKLLSRPDDPSVPPYRMYGVDRDDLKK
jgi:hypothetical protein